MLKQKLKLLKKFDSINFSTITINYINKLTSNKGPRILHMVQIKPTHENPTQTYTAFQNVYRKRRSNLFYRHFGNYTFYQLDI